MWEEGSDLSDLLFKDSVLRFHGSVPAWHTEWQNGENHYEEDPQICNLELEILTIRPLHINKFKVEKKMFHDLNSDLLICSEISNWTFIPNSKNK